MRLSKDDKNEILKAALVAGKAKDYEGFTDWIVEQVCAFDDLPEGKADLAMTTYRAPVKAAPGATSSDNGQASLMPLAG